MDHVLFEFSSDFTTNNKSEWKKIQKLCRELKRPLQRRGLRFYVKVKNNSQKTSGGKIGWLALEDKYLPGGCIFFDRKLSHHLGQEPVSYLARFLAWHPASIRDFFSSEKNDSSKENAKKETYNKTIVFKNKESITPLTEKETHLKWNVRIKTELDFLLFIDCFVRAHYDSRGLLRDENGKLWFDKHYWRSSADVSVRRWEIYKRGYIPGYKKRIAQKLTEWKNAKTAYEDAKKAYEKAKTAYEAVEKSEKTRQENQETTPGNKNPDSQDSSGIRKKPSTPDDVPKEKLDYLKTVAEDAKKKVAKKAEEAEKAFEEAQKMTAGNLGVPLIKNMMQGSFYFLFMCPFMLIGKVLCGFFVILHCALVLLGDWCFGGYKVADWRTEMEWRSLRNISVGIGGVAVILGMIWGLNYFFLQYLPGLIWVGNILNAILLFVLLCILVAGLTRPYMEKIGLKVLIFGAVFVFGILAYQSYYERSVKPAIMHAKWVQYPPGVDVINANLVLMKNPNSADHGPLVTAAGIVNSSIASFFPSRGEYEMKPEDTGSGCYYLFHFGCYIFFGYFALALFGQRIINRTRFIFTPQYNKYFIWCKSAIEPQELKLAESIHARSDNEQVCFSVLEEVFAGKNEKFSGDAKDLFLEMNFRLFCLKLRKPGQIHNAALSIPEHFFITSDVAWNWKMSRDFLKKRRQFSENGHILPPARLYIRVNKELEEICRSYRDIKELSAQYAIKIILINDKQLISDNYYSKGIPIEGKLFYIEEPQETEKSVEEASSN